MLITRGLGKCPPIIIRKGNMTKVLATVNAKKKIKGKVTEQCPE